MRDVDSAAPKLPPENWGFGPSPPLLPMCLSPLCTPTNTHSFLLRWVFSLCSGGEGLAQGCRSHWGLDPAHQAASAGLAIQKERTPRSPHTYSAFHVHGAGDGETALAGHTSGMSWKRALE